jgi:UDP-N-acetylmuramate--alanine ligase
MAGLAALLAALGHRVDGCDAAPARTADYLRRHGVPVHPAHSPSHLDGIDWAFYSPAVPPDAPERLAAAQLGIPLYPRGEVLAALCTRFQTIAVAGTHGKTTTASMIAHILQTAGQSPSYAIGGELPPDGAPARLGTSPWLVVEADESDGTLAHYAPHLAVVTNIEFDHADHFPDLPAFRRCFQTFAARATSLLACADDPEAAALAASHPAAATWTLADLLPTATPSPDGWTWHLPDDPTPYHLPLPGQHNLSNAWGAVTAAARLGIPPKTAAAALATFQLPKRRLETTRTPSGITIVADYAHHPTEIRALFAAVRQRYPTSRLLYAFQPHRYTRTRLLGPQFPPAFQDAAAGVLLPVYPASEPYDPAGTSETLADLFPSATRPTLLPDLPAAAARLAALARPNDVILVIGAGSIEHLVPHLLPLL